MTENELQNANYNEILFRGRRVLQQKEGEFKNLLIASSFSAWQTLGAKGIIKEDWKTYLKRLHLLDEENLTGANVKQDYENAIANSERIRQKARERIKSKG